MNATSMEIWTKILGVETGKNISILLSLESMAFLFLLVCLMVTLNEDVRRLNRKLEK